MSQTAGSGSDYSQLIDVVNKLSRLQRKQVQLLSKLRRLRKWEDRLRKRRHEEFPPGSPTLMESLQRVEPIVERCRADFVRAILGADETQRHTLEDHHLRNPDPGDVNDDWNFKYAAFNVAFANAMEVMDTAGSDSAKAKALDTSLSAAEVGNAIVGSAVHGLPAGGVYKEVKDNIEGIVGFAKGIGGVAKRGAKRAGRWVKKRVHRGRAPHEEPAPVARSAEEREGGQSPPPVVT